MLLAAWIVLNVGFHAILRLRVALTMAALMLCGASAIALDRLPRDTSAIASRVPVIGSASSVERSVLESIARCTLSESQVVTAVRFRHFGSNQVWVSTSYDMAVFAAIPDLQVTRLPHGPYAPANGPVLSAHWVGVPIPWYRSQPLAIEIAGIRTTRSAPTGPELVLFIGSASLWLAFCGGGVAVVAMARASLWLCRGACPRCGYPQATEGSLRCSECRFSANPI